MSPRSRRQPRGLRGSPATTGRPASLRDTGERPSVGPSDRAEPMGGCGGLVADWRLASALRLPPTGRAERLLLSAPLVAQDRAHAPDRDPGHQQDRDQRSDAEQNELGCHTDEELRNRPRPPPGMLDQPQGGSPGSPYASFSFIPIVSTVRARLRCRRTSMRGGALAVLLFIAVALGYLAGRAHRFALGPLRWSGRLSLFVDRD